MFKTPKECHQIIKDETSKADIDNFVLSGIKKIPGHQFKNDHIYPLKPKTDVLLELQLQKKIQFLLISKFIFNKQLIFRQFYLPIRSPVGFKWTREL